jgi:hypothetical protein
MGFYILSQFLIFFLPTNKRYLNIFWDFGYSPIMKGVTVSGFSMDFIIYEKDLKFGYYTGQPLANAFI